MTDKIETQEQLTKWVQEQFQRANKHLAEQGILFDTVVTEESRYLAPSVAVWKIKDTKKKFYWVISGDLPADALPASVATSARDAIKHFSMSWQLKAENILRNSTSDQVQKDYAALLGEKADLLYEVQEKDEWWQQG
jgi:regulator of protease activity HflC (stomatin/prohibitin superfamily)